MIDRLWDFWETGARARAAEPAAAARFPGVPIGRFLTKTARSTVAYVAVGGLFVALAVFELKTSWIQAKLLSAIARRATFTVAAGPSPSSRFPRSAPYDERLGYSQLPVFLGRLEQSGYSIAEQARTSDVWRRLQDAGLLPLYREKTQAGLEVMDRNGRPLFSARYPTRLYETYAEIPPVVVETLLFIENRQILNGNYPYRNPAFEWDRLGKAFLDFGWNKVRPGHPISGGSTLATQLEKARHSPGGRTGSPPEKLRQLASASLRAYMDGPVTLQTRERIVRDYINSFPLAAQAGYGEVGGLGDGLWTWFGADFDAVNRLLAGGAKPRAGDPLLPARALAFRQVLSLLLALNQPSNFLIADPAALGARAESYLRLLAEAGIISPALRDAALRTRMTLLSRAPAAAPVSFAGRKAVDAVRAGLMSSLHVPSIYSLDRLDLNVRSTLDGPVQREVTRVLRELGNPATAASEGLRGEHMLSGAEPGSVIYSFTLYERTPGANALRVQADNLDQPLNINQGTKLELGSTAKLRTLVNYLDIVRGLHARYAAMPAAELQALPVPPEDPLTAWAAEYLASGADRSLPAMLEAAMNRRYRASPAEGFFTGGGLHYFGNFDREDNARILTVREAFERSVNLVFIRLMRDVVRYYAAREERLPREQYLRRFASEEGREFLARFYRKYEGMDQQDALRKLLDGIHPTPKRLAAIFRSVRPGASLGEFALFLAPYSPASGWPWKTMESLYSEYGPDKFNLADRGYLAGVHPLELWLLEYKGLHPRAGWREVLAASASRREEAYAWLYKTRNPAGQDKRIRQMIELDAFRRMHADWKRLGFPFDSLVPSYATAIGSSGDNPAALAELMGILINGGVRYPAVRVDELRFAAGTPYETVMDRRAARGERVLASEVAAVVTQELRGVVEKGTARRAYGAFPLPGGGQIAVGGKTGTGDNPFVKNRTATFVFEIGGRFFGTLTAYVSGRQAAAYEFTSALPVQIFRQLAPELGELRISGPR